MRAEPSAPPSGAGRTSPILRRAGRWLGLAIAAAAVIGLWLQLLAPTGLGGPVSLIWVNGSSMEPGLRGGDLALLYQQDDYRVGDIVAFEIPEGGVVIHRIIEATADGYRFQGDNRDHPDQWTLGADDIVGRQVLAVPSGARAMALLARPDVLAVLSGLLVLLWLMRRAQREGAGAPS